VTIPAVWRRRHRLQGRTRVVVAATESGILLKRVGRVRHGTV
jgi:bifunctional DNA-binding transcriptional regulator/antitoxin component of YhaV-PrlF toxin-antitoxin module